MAAVLAEADFRFLDRFPGRKLLVKGNHDYWWNTAAKLHRFFEEKGIRTLEILHNNCAFYGDYAICGTRGWFLEEDQKPHNAKVLNREVLRLALVRSVTCTLPPVSFQTSHVSTVPNRISPASARSRAPGTLSRIHLIFVAEK